MLVDQSVLRDSDSDEEQDDDLSHSAESLDGGRHGFVVDGQGEGLLGLDAGFELVGVFFAGFSPAHFFLLLVLDLLDLPRPVREQAGVLLLGFLPALPRALVPQEGVDASTGGLLVPEHLDQPLDFAPDEFFAEALGSYEHLVVVSAAHGLVEEHVGSTRGRGGVGVEDGRLFALAAGVREMHFSAALGALAFFLLVLRDLGVVFGLVLLFFLVVSDGKAAVEALVDALALVEVANVAHLLEFKDSRVFHVLQPPLLLQPLQLQEVLVQHVVLVVGVAQFPRELLVYGVVCELESVLDQALVQGRDLGALGQGFQAQVEAVGEVDQLEVDFIQVCLELQGSFLISNGFVLVLAVDVILVGIIIVSILVIALLPAYTLGRSQVDVRHVVVVHVLCIVSVQHRHVLRRRVLHFQLAHASLVVAFVFRLLLVLLLLPQLAHFHQLGLVEGDQGARLVSELLLVSLEELGEDGGQVVVDDLFVDFLEGHA